ncbi:MAG: hypothetical protein ACO4CG_16075 [Prochlorothrix sp.]
MTMLSPSQKAHLYVTAAAQWGIHAPLLVALAQVQGQPQLPQGETGLGMTPAGSLPPTTVQDFGGQVQAAAQTLCHMLDYLQAWEHLGPTGTNLWDGQRGTYTAALVQRVAQGYSPDRHHGYTNGDYTNGGYTNGGYSPASGVSDRIEPEPFQQLSQPPQQLQPPQQPVPSLSAPPQASATVGTFAPFPISSPSQPSAPLAQLEPCNAHRLIQAYDWACVQEVQGWDLPQDWTWLDGRLQQVCQRLPRFYRDLNFQREALLSAAQVWLGQADREQLLAYWGNPSPLDLPALCFRFLQERLAAGGDRPLLAPPQREALILLVQRWHQWPSRLGTLLALVVCQA